MGREHEVHQSAGNRTDDSIQAYTWMLKNDEVGIPSLGTNIHEKIEMAFQCKEHATKDKTRHSSYGCMEESSKMVKWSKVKTCAAEKV